MRLLHLQPDGSLGLTADLTGAVPSYAILSHTWGADDQEVNFQDITQPRDYKQKLGYKKLAFCQERAASDGLRHFWVDTCCIDKANSTELSEAINSMFRWYQNAAECYVYLPDVSADENKAEEPMHAPWELAFRNSRWFTRGWTLQELIAPKSVTFFSSQGRRLGDKTTLETVLHEITGIPFNALRGKPLAEFGTSERFSWLGTRATKRAEDRVYCLLGIFDIFLPLIYGEGEQNALIRLQQEIDSRSRGRSSVPDESRDEAHFIVPFGRNEGFVGRESVMQQLLDRIAPTTNNDDCQRTAVWGLGGVGKTQVAIEAAYRVREAHKDTAVFWVPAIDVATFENAYREIGRALGVRGIESDNADVKALVKAALSRDSSPRWLLIIDNADDMDLMFNKANLMSSLPFSRRGSILFTTRNHQAAANFRTRGHIIPLRAMDDADAAELLLHGLDETQISNAQDTAELLDHLAYLPLAIRQASAYMASNISITVTKYLEYCTSSDKNMIKMLSKDFDDQDRYETLQNPIATTWLISFEHVVRDAALAAKYLRHICFFAEKDIPVSLLPDGEDEMERDEAISTLRSYAFILDRGTPGRFDIHRLVRLAMRNWLQEQGEQSRQVTDTFRRFNEKTPWPEHNTRNLWSLYLPHAQSTLAYMNECFDQKALATLLERVAQCYYLLGKYKEGGQLLRQLLELRETVLGREHPATIRTMDTLGSSLFRQGKYAEAEQMGRQALTLREKVLGREHPDTLESMDQLGNSLHVQGKEEKARQIYQQTLTLREKVLGREHPDTLKSMNSLGLSLRTQGEFAEAEQKFRETLSSEEKMLGREHPDTLLSMDNLAITLGGQGRHKEAEQSFREVLALREKVLGREHPDTLGSMHNLAVALGKQGKHEEAEQSFREVLALEEKVLGREHPDTLGSMYDLAAVLGKQGKREEAEKRIREVLALREKVLGQEHRDTLFTQRVLAWMLDRRGENSTSSSEYKEEEEGEEEEEDSDDTRGI